MSLRSKYLRRSAAGAVALALISLSACSSSTEGFDALEVKTQESAAPEVTYPEDWSAGELEVEVVEKGDGPVTKEGDVLKVNVTIENASTETMIAEDVEEPVTVALAKEELFPGIYEALIGQAAGSTIVAVGNAEATYVEGGVPQMSIGNEDSIIITARIVEIVSGEELEEFEKQAEEQAKQQEAQAEAQAKRQEKSEELAEKSLKSAKGRTVAPAGWAPATDFSGDVPTMKFAKGSKPDGDLRFTHLIKGTGAKVKEGDLVAVNYVGQKHGDTTPFDDSYSRGEPLTFVAGAGEMIAGFDEAVSKGRVGDRMIIEIPPALGYGEAGSEGAGITGEDTIVFVVDIIGAV